MPTRNSGASGVRLAAVAGSWYPEDPSALRALVEEMLASARPTPTAGRLRGLVVPHAGIVYSGRTAAHAFARIHAEAFDRVLVMAPSHRVPLRGIAVDPSTHYETPLGRMAVDADAVELLTSRFGFERNERPFVREHAIEMQLPFLQVVMPHARLVPMLVGELRAPERAAAAVDLGTVVDARTVVVVSSDFVHYGSAYGYVPFHDHVPERIRDLDEEAIAAIGAHDPVRFHRHLESTGATICGRRPLGVLLELVPPAWRMVRCAYTTSGEITGDWTHSVSYASLAFYDEDEDEAAVEPVERAAEPGALSFDAGERRDLLFAARQALEALFAPPAIEARTAAIARSMRLQRPAGVFVTLHRKRDGRLRGCIGTLSSRQQLLEAVIDSARAAATRDPRFTPLQAGEVAEVEIEISVLGDLVPVRDVDEIVIGRDGLVVTSGLRRGVLLPQVATEHRWDRQTFLENVCRKAGLAADAWRRGATLERFEAVVFGEGDVTKAG